MRVNFVSQINNKCKSVRHNTAYWLSFSLFKLFSNVVLQILHYRQNHPKKNGHPSCKGRQHMRNHTNYAAALKWLDCFLAWLCIKNTVYTHRMQQDTHTHTHDSAEKGKHSTLPSSDTLAQHTRLHTSSALKKTPKKPEQHSHVLQHLGRKISENCRTPLFHTGLSRWCSRTEDGAQPQSTIWREFLLLTNIFMTGLVFDKCLLHEQMFCHHKQGPP